MLSYFEKRISIFLQLKKISCNWLYSILAVYGIINPPKIICKLRNGIKVCINKNPGDLEVIIENWVPECGNHYFSNFREIIPGSIMIDIGANIGTFSLYIKRKSKDLTVFCYEPDEENYKCLKENIRLNELRNVFAFPFAVGNKNGKIKIYTKKNRKFGTTGSSTAIVTDDFNEVRCVTLNEILDKNNISKCDLLKMDCEGAEYDILLSQGKECFKRIDTIILEYHDFKFLKHDHNVLEKHLSKFEYHVESIPFRDKPTGMMKAVKKQ